MKKNKFLALLYGGALLISLENTIFSSKMNTFNLNDLPSPYCDLATILPFNEHGWYANGQWIEKIITTNNVTTVIEVGSWLGSSTRHIASLLPEGGIVYAVDVWAETPEVVQHLSAASWSSIHPVIYEQFLSNVIHVGLTDKIIPLKMLSQDAASLLSTYETEFDLIYIDAAHDTISVTKDLGSYFPLIANTTGILCGDDWTWQSVQIAVLAFAEKHNLTVYADYNFWFLKKNDAGYCLKSFISAQDDAWKFDIN